MMASKSFEKHPAYKELYDALIKSLLVDEDDMDQAAVATDESVLLKRKHDDQDKDLTESSKGNTPSKSSKSGKSVTIEEPDEEHVHDISLDAKENIIDKMGNAGEQPDGKAEPNTDNASKNDWFKLPPKPPTLDPEWNKYQVIDDEPKQPWFINMLFAQKDPPIFDKFVTTPIGFSNFAKNRLKLDKITKEDLVGLV
ncbi:hypothetical protein Tco_0843766 [Tanacetum coccineum]